MEGQKRKNSQTRIPTRTVTLEILDAGNFFPAVTKMGKTLPYSQYGNGNKDYIPTTWSLSPDDI